MFKEILKTIKLDALLAAVLCIIFGLVLIFQPMLTTVLICRILGIVIIINGIGRLLNYFFKNESMFRQLDLIIGVLLTVVGCWILFSPTSVIKIIPIIFGFVMIVHGATDLKHATNLHQYEDNNWKLAGIFALVTILLGEIVLFNPFSAMSTLIRFIGIFLAYDGISDVWIILKISKAIKKAEPIDVQSKVIDSK